MTNVIVKVPWERPVTYSYAEVPREVPLELRSYFPDVVAKGSAVVVQFDGNTYQTLDSLTGNKLQVAMEIDTGEIVTLDFESAFRTT